MLMQTSRFGTVELAAEDLVLFRDGLVGYTQSRHWVLLADEAHPHVAWLQSLADPDVALAAISPRQLVPGYKVRVNRRQLACLDLRPETPVHVLIVLAKNAGQLTVNLRAPVLLNLERGLGCQVVTVDDQPVRHALADFSAQLYRRSA